MDFVKLTCPVSNTHFFDQLGQSCISSDNVEFEVDPIRGLAANVLINGKQETIRNEWIDGIPPSIRYDALSLNGYLADSYARLVPLSEGYKVQVKGRLNGGTGRGNPREEITDQDFRLLNEAIDEATACENKKLVAFLGLTGVGKSTAINHLCGLEMEIGDPIQKNLKVKDGQDPIAGIGVNSSNSFSTLARVCIPKEAAGLSYEFLDCGGFDDTRGPMVDVAVVTSMKYSLEDAEVKLVLCLNGDMFARYNDKNKALKNSFGKILGTFVKKHKNYSKSILVLILNPSESLDWYKMRLEVIREEFATDGEQNLVNACNFVLARERMLIYDSQTQESRDSVLKAIDRLEFIAKRSDREDKFEPVFSTSSMLFIQKMTNSISNEGYDVYNRLNINLKSIAEQEESLRNIGKKYLDANKRYEESVRDLRAALRAARTRKEGIEKKLEEIEEELDIGTGPLVYPSDHFNPFYAAGYELGEAVGQRLFGNWGNGGDNAQLSEADKWRLAEEARERSRRQTEMMMQDRCDRQIQMMMQTQRLDSRMRDKEEKLNTVTNEISSLEQQLNNAVNAHSEKEKENKEAASIIESKLNQLRSEEDVLKTQLESISPRLKMLDRFIELTRMTDLERIDSMINYRNCRAQYETNKQEYDRRQQQLRRPEPQNPSATRQRPDEAPN